MATDKKILTTKLDEDNEDRRKEISALKANIQKERDELRGQVCSNSQKEIQADQKALTMSEKYLQTPEIFLCAPAKSIFNEFIC